MPPSRKRKREHGGGGGDDDDDATYGLRQILPVANLPNDFDGEPTDGMQYLFTVRYVLSVIFVERFKDGMTSTGEMHGDYPISNTSTTPTLAVLHSLLRPPSNLFPNKHKMWRCPRHSQAKNGAANSRIAFVTSVV